jgi:ATP-dependent DNA helicase RecQ
MEVPSEWRSKLREVFGKDDFHDYQKPVLKALMEERRSMLVIMPTGKGKSLCYQFPPVFWERCCLVISPLISLIEDQHLGLRGRGIASEIMTGKHRADAEAITSGRCRVVFTTPETLLGRGGEALMEWLRDVLCLVAIDEAHCVSQWGHDFRPQYCQILDGLRWAKGVVPIVALTATAPPAVAKDICRYLGGGMREYRISTQKDNLAIAVRPKDRDFRVSLRPLLSELSGAAIIYVNKRASAEEISQWIVECGWRGGCYHAGMEEEAKRKVHTEFLHDRLQVVVATVAFALGIDKPDVRLVINWGMPGDIGTYYQEIGRAGRDGGACQAVMFWSPQDAVIARHFIEAGAQKQSMDGGEEAVVERVKRHRLEALLAISNYCKGGECRQMYLEAYLATPELASKFSCGRCDQCCLKGGGGAGGCSGLMDKYARMPVEEE